MPGRSWKYLWIGIVLSPPGAGISQCAPTAHSIMSFPVCIRVGVERISSWKIYSVRGPIHEKTYWKVLENACSYSALSTKLVHSLCFGKEEVCGHQLCTRTTGFWAPNLFFCVALWSALCLKSSSVRHSSTPLLRAHSGKESTLYRA